MTALLLTPTALRVALALALGSTLTSVLSSPLASPLTGTLSAQTPTCAAPTQSAGELAGFPLTALCEGVWVDGQVAASKHAALRQMVQQAAARNAAFFGTLRGAQPLQVLCKSSACLLHFSGRSLRSVALMAGNRAAGAAFTASGATLVVNLNEAQTEDVLTHERLHLELEARTAPELGKTKLPVPTWFHEGLATLVSGYPRCDAAKTYPPLERAKLATLAQWNAHTGGLFGSNTAYCQARAEVSAWVDKRGREQAVAQLDGLAQGGELGE